MKRLIALAAGLAAVLLMVPAAQADEAAAGLVKVLGSIQAMEAAFSQQTVDGKGRAQPLQTGRMGVKRPGLFRWEVQKPSPQLVLTAGRVLWIYDPELMQATKQRLDAQVGNTPALLLSGDPARLAAAFAISEEKAAAGERVFVLRPRGKDALFEQLRVRFAEGRLMAMELTDTLSQRTDIRFSDIRLNPEFPPRYFDFVPPKGVDVIDQL